jgi:hypothetical protein
MKKDNRLLSKLKESLFEVRWKLRPILRGSNTRQVIATLALMLGLPLSVYLTREFVLYRARAANTALLYLTPATTVLPPDTTFKVMVDAKTNQLGFVRVDLSFNPSNIILTNEIQTSLILSNVVQKTSMTNANSTGKVTLVLALPAENRTNPPTGVIELASLSFKSNTGIPDVTTGITYDNSSIQLVNLATEVIPFTSENASLTLNQTPPVTSPLTNTPTTVATATLIPTNTMTPSPIPTKTPTPTLVPTNTNTPTLVPTNTSTPTIRPSNTLTPTVAPKQGDVNGDGIVNTVDIGIIVDNYLRNPIIDSRADLNKDGIVNIVDLGIVIDNYLQ